MSETQVFVVDDDPAMRAALCSVIGALGLAAAAFDSGAALLRSIDADDCGCVLIDFRMPQMNGLELQQNLHRRNIRLPVIIITAFGEVPTAVEALRNGAIDFLEKPFREEQLARCIGRALAIDRDQRLQSAQQEEIAARLERLDDKLREVLDRLCAGQSNRTIAKALGLSIRAVELRRSRLMAVMESTNLAELIRMVSLAERRSRC